MTASRQLSAVQPRRLDFPALESYNPAVKRSHTTKRDRDGRKPISLYEPDHGGAVTALGAALSAVPHIGGPLSNILSGAWAKRKETRLREAFERVGSLLRLVDSSKVDWEYVRSEEFEGLVVLCLENIVGEHRQDRRALYVNILTNSVLLASPSAKTQAEWFAESLSRMSPYHMLAFRATAMAEEDLESFLKDVGTQPGALQALQACAGDLRSAGFIEFDTRLPVPTIISNMVTLFRFAQVTEIGTLFVEWITEPRSSTQPDTAPGPCTTDERPRSRRGYTRHD